MAKLRQTKSEEEIKKIGVAAVRQSYNELARDYNRIMDGKLFYCHKCNEFHNATSFYSDKRFASGLFPVCKKCLIKEATDYDKATNSYIDNREKTKKVFQMMDLPFIDELYTSVLTNATEGVGERNRQTAYSYMITCVKSLPQYSGLTWADSVFEDELETEKEINENSRILKQAKKRFGKEYSPTDLIFLENEYQDWIKRYACENKAQEILYKNICLTELNIDRKQKAGKDTKDETKTLQDLMSSLQIKPSQSNSNALTEAKTFGQLIQKWEDEWDGGKPIPDPDPDLADIDKVGTLIDVFFKGHLAKMMGLKNGFSRLYDKFIAKYTVKRPQYDEDSDSEAIFEQLFGKDDDL